MPRIISSRVQILFPRSTEDDLEGTLVGYLRPTSSPDDFCLDRIARIHLVSEEVEYNLGNGKKITRVEEVPYLTGTGDEQVLLTTQMRDKKAWNNLRCPSALAVKLEEDGKWEMTNLPVYSQWPTTAFLPVLTIAEIDRLNDLKREETAQKNKGVVFQELHYVVGIVLDRFGERDGLIVANAAFYCPSQKQIYAPNDPEMTSEAEKERIRTIRDIFAGSENSIRGCYSVPLRSIATIEFFTLPDKREMPPLFLR